MRANTATFYAGFLMLFVPFSVRPASYTFSADELENTSQTTVKNIDVAQFNHATWLPGIYYVSVRRNGQAYNKMKIKFIAKGEGLTPLLTPRQGQILALDLTLAKGAKTGPADLLDITTRFPGSSVQLDLKKLQLTINIPQIYLLQNDDADFNVPPLQWDEGINALLLNYDVSGSQVSTDDSAFHAGDRFLKLNGGLNLGAWHIRSQGTFDKPENGKTSWEANDSWIQRDISAIRSTLYIGNRSSDATLFDGFSFTGVSLSSTDSMLSDKLQGYAPVVRGIAKTANARVRISQNGSVIYQSYVPAGAFEIKDIYPQSGAGELLVSIKETDGSEHHFYQPWGSVSVMQRPGHLKYSLDTGRYDSSGQSEHPRFYQSSLFYGLPYSMTLFGGIQLAEEYSAVDPGYAVSIGKAGALSVDATMMQNRLSRNRTTQGKSYRLQYAASLVPTRSDITLSWAFSPDEGYLSYANALQNLHDNSATYSSQKSKVQLTVNQPIFDSASLTLSLWKTEYWHNSADKNLSLGYNQTWHNLTFSAGWSWTQNEDGSADQQLVANVQIPLSALSDSTWLNSGISVQRPGTPSQSLAVNGDNTLNGNDLAWNIGAVQGNSESRSLNASGDYKSRHGEYQASYSDSADSQRLTWRAQGSFLASAYGITAGQPFDSTDTLALVSAPDAEGLKVAGSPGVATDGSGLAMVSGLQPYRDNTLSLESEGIAGDTTLDTTAVHLTPTEGAVVLAQFTAHTGKKLLVTLRRPDGTLVPFGATATAGGQSNEGIVDDRGQLFLSGAPVKGEITVSWGDPHRQCRAGYQLHPQKGKYLYELNLVCA